MRKIAIFVEGHTELIVVRDYLLTYFEYSNIDLQCRTLFSDGKLHHAEYDFPNSEAEYHYQIINVGNDNAVLSRILKRETYMWNAGYKKIIGLRDMYGKDYREESSVIDENINEKFVSGAEMTIAKIAKFPDQIKMCFAIMEVEAWFLAMDNLFAEIDLRLNNDFIKEKLGIDLNEIDPEKKIFHPANVIGNIYGLVNRKYRKKQGDIEAIVNKIDIQRFNELLLSAKCDSFSKFHNEII